MKYDTPKLRYTNERILGEIGFSHLLIFSALIPVFVGICAMLAFGAKSGTAIWMALQISIIGTAVGVYLSKVRGAVGQFERSTWAAQHELDFSGLVKRIYNNPVLEYWVLGWGTFGARAFVVLTSSAAASFFFDMSFGMAFSIAIVLQIFDFSAPILLVVGCLAKLVSGSLLGSLPMMGQVRIPDFDNIPFALMTLALAVTVGHFQKVRDARKLGAGDDQRELASGSGFYIAHEVIGGLLSDALAFGGGYERARDGIRLCSVEEQTAATLSEGWKPAVGDLHKGQTVDTAELVSALREAANAESMHPPAPDNAPSLAQSLRDDAQQAAA